MRTFNINSRYVHMKDAVVTVGQYADGSTALTAEASDEDGYPDRETLSVNLSGLGHVAPYPDTIYVPTWSEHDGLPGALQDAGIATDTGEAVEIDYGTHRVVAVLMRLDKEVLSA